jgi:hypothetical protein
MKRLLLFAILGGLALSSAAQSEADTSILIRGQQIQLPTKAHTMFRGDFDAYKGSYDLSNGETMTLRQVGSRMYAEVGNRARTELVAAARNEFVAVDRQFKMTLNRDWNGDVSGHMLMVPVRGDRPSTASTGLIEMHVAAR